MWCQWSVKKPIDELTVQVWLLYHHPNFKYCTVLVSGTELRTDRQTDKQTDRRTDGQTDDPITRCPPADLSGRGHKKIINDNVYFIVHLFLLVQLKKENFDFFPLDRALSLSGMGKDSTETKIDDLLYHVTSIVDKQRREVRLSRQNWTRVYKVRSWMSMFMFLGDSFNLIEPSVFFRKREKFHRIRLSVCLYIEKSWWKAFILDIHDFRNIVFIIKAHVCT